MTNEPGLIARLVEAADRLADALNDPGMDNATAARLINGWYKGELRAKATVSQDAARATGELA